MARVSEWFHRYAVAEVAGLVCALVAAVAVGRTAGPAAAAIAGTLGEGVGFYGVILLRELRRHGPNWRVARGLVVEFGLAEVADTLAVRPLAMYAATVLAGDTLVGVLVGKVAADVVFYAVAITGYELRKRLDTRTAVAPAAATRVEGRPAVTGRFDERLAAVAGRVAMAPTVSGRLCGQPAVADQVPLARAMGGRLYGRPAVAGRVAERPADAGAAYGRWAAAGRVDGQARGAVRVG